MTAVDAKIIWEYERKMAAIIGMLVESETDRANGDYPKARERVVAAQWELRGCLLDLEYLQTGAAAPDEEPTV